MAKKKSQGKLYNYLAMGMTGLTDSLTGSFLNEVPYACDHVKHIYCGRVS